MKTYLLLLACFPFLLCAQTPDFCLMPDTFESFATELFSAGIGTGGDMFLQEDLNHLKVKSIVDEQWISTIHEANLVMAGYNSEGKVVAAWGRNSRYFGRFDYSPGYLDLSEETDDPDKCINWDRIWRVKGESIRVHLQEIAAHGYPLIKRPDLYAYPAKGNPHFSEYAGFDLPNIKNQDFAPFYDANNDKIYNPEDGDYPLPESVDHNAPPDEMFWLVFNDYDHPHAVSESDPLGVEVQLTAFRYNCNDDPLINRAIFTQHKIINRGHHPIDSLAVGSRVVFTLGYFGDDYQGTAPELNTFYIYNSDSIDNFNPYLNIPPINGTELPVAAVTFLNHPLEYAMPTSIYATFDVPTTLRRPYTPEGMFNYLNGRWNDGTRLTIGSFGYTYGNTNYTNHVFHDNPNDPNGWSAVTAEQPDGDKVGFVTKQFGTLNPGGIIQLDQVWSFHQGVGNDHLENVDLMYEQIPILQRMYNIQFAGLSCVATSVENDIESALSVKVFPNPTTGQITIKSEQIDIQKIEIIDVQGRLLWSKNFKAQILDIDVSDLPAQMYLVKIYTDHGINTKRFIKI